MRFTTVSRASDAGILQAIPTRQNKVSSFFRKHATSAIVGLASLAMVSYFTPAYSQTKVNPSNVNVAKTNSEIPSLELKKGIATFKGEREELHYYFYQPNPAFDESTAKLKFVTSDQNNNAFGFYVFEKDLVCVQFSPSGSGNSRSYYFNYSQSDDIIFTGKNQYFLTKDDVLFIASKSGNLYRLAANGDVRSSASSVSLSFLSNSKHKNLRVKSFSNPKFEQIGTKIILYDDVSSCNWQIVIDPKASGPALEPRAQKTSGTYVSSSVKVILQNRAGLPEIQIIKGVVSINGISGTISKDAVNKTYAKERFQINRIDTTVDISSAKLSFSAKLKNKEVFVKNPGECYAYYYVFDTTAIAIYAYRPVPFDISLYKLSVCNLSFENSDKSLLENNAVFSNSSGDNSLFTGANQYHFTSDGALFLAGNNGGVYCFFSEAASKRNWFSQIPNFTNPKFIEKSPNEIILYNDVPESTVQLRINPKSSIEVKQK
jgi:hypothetical protein